MKPADFRRMVSRPMETPARYYLAKNVVLLSPRPAPMKLDGEAPPPYVHSSTCSSPPEDSSRPAKVTRLSPRSPSPRDTVENRPKR